MRYCKVRQAGLRALASRYTQAKIHFLEAFCGTINQITPETGVIWKPFKL